jgi:kynurenine formamidase
MSQMGLSQNNTFDVRYWEVEFPDGVVSGSNSYFTLFNHGGPHVDAPSHMDLGAGLDSFPIDAFAGPLKVIDVSEYALGRSVPLDAIRQHRIRSGDVVLIYTGYKPPTTDVDVPHRIALTREAAEYLATLPVRAFGTDAFNVDSDDNPTPVKSDSAVERVAPIHYIFLTRGIPIFEQLFNVDQLIGKENMYFVGQPLNIKDGDGMMVRPVVLVY